MESHRAPTTQEPAASATRGLDAFSLKLFAMLCMLLDHVNTYIAHGFSPEWVSLIPRFVAPLFVFFLVEGFFHTHSRRAYAIRLYAGAAIMMAGNIAINAAFQNADPLTGQVTIYSLIQGHDIFLTLAVFLSIMCLAERARDAESPMATRITAAAGTLALCALSLICEGGIYLLPVLFCFYVFRARRGLALGGIALWCTVLFANAFLGWQSGATGTTLLGTLCFDGEWAMVAVIPLVALYNGTRGPNTPAAKNLFYWFYPVHLWTLMILAHLLAG